MTDSDIPCLDGLREIAGQYDGFILDMWGVLHDGVRVYPGVTDCLGRLQRRGKRMVILSNAPRRRHEVAARAAAIGLPRLLYDDVLSSGEEAWLMLAARREPDADPWYAMLDGACHHLGPDRDREMRDGLDEVFVEDLDRAGFILNTGTLNTTDTITDYQDLLDRALSRKLPMICANPDLIVMRGGTLEICAGTVADRYVEMGGNVRYHGKPDGGVYARVRAMLGIDDKARILAVGDSMRTDVAGARRCGIDVAFLPGGIHTPDTGLPHGERPERSRMAPLFARYGVAPTYAMAALRW